MSNSTTSKLGDKRAVLKAARNLKAKEKIPLLVHNTMRWGRKVNGAIRYFGKIDGALPDFGAAAALEEYHRTIDDIRAGREPRPKDSDLATLQTCVNAFLQAKAEKRDQGELSPNSWTNYHRTCGRIIDALGKHRAVADLDVKDFRRLRAAFAGGNRGPVAVGNEIRHARILFKFCYDEQLIDRPVRYGQAFDMPSAKTLRLARAARGPRMFEADELRKLLDTAGPVLKAMILLGVNCGFGQSDLARLPKSAVKAGWIEYARHKTGVPRRIPLWPETVKALKAAVAVRPQPEKPENDKLVFLTPSGTPVVRNRIAKRKEERRKAEVVTRVDTVARAFKALMQENGIDGNRNYYALRHTLETIGGDTGDQVAVSAVMGHAPRAGDMSSVYRERIDDSRLRRVVDHVHDWLFGTPEKTDNEV